MYERFAKSRIEEALADTRVVHISELRQSGKTTLAIDIAAANDDPVGFLRVMDRGVIDEIQRAQDFVNHLCVERLESSTRYIVFSESYQRVASRNIGPNVKRF